MGISLVFMGIVIFGGFIAYILTQQKTIMILLHEVKRISSGASSMIKEFDL